MCSISVSTVIVAMWQWVKQRRLFGSKAIYSFQQTDDVDHYIYVRIHPRYATFSTESLSSFEGQSLSD
ncbi:hypothetical protein HRR90_006724 [Exophiala dermatitidis]|uniref:Uncharacterized protein n=1 Tax=Exophiala dermatitidis TaxID=5970 RepID=A0AAN6EN22_EXODE|nr:hypothetical protein HRR73_008787 [Exophiala dermatitidis]KAJ4505304.1 hypothetical protein HRR74_008674 [Exophiala dermatitidis]KAJ4530711.1 hypothetical protein HRR76_008409 [Exophiala dermatitidis]KAJ4563211.1 hypothetical protein HRR81_008537 [Exophiala dermatitidis]KAJ4570677.1 hypothetical protein HRR79_003617 [Exophiala dermatitidis]